MLVLCKMLVNVLLMKIHSCNESLIQYMVSNGINTFVEIGTGTVLGGLVKRIAEGMAILSLGNPQDFAVLE